MSTAMTGAAAPPQSPAVHSRQSFPNRRGILSSSPRPQASDHEHREIGPRTCTACRGRPVIPGAGTARLHKRSERRGRRRHVMQERRGESLELLSSDPKLAATVGAITAGADRFDGISSSAVPCGPDWEPSLDRRHAGIRARAVIGHACRAAQSRHRVVARRWLSTARFVADLHRPSAPQGSDRAGGFKCGAERRHRRRGRVKIQSGGARVGNAPSGTTR